jgi:hypothetical protein
VTIAKASSLKKKLAKEDASSILIQKLHIATGLAGDKITIGTSSF